MTNWKNLLCWIGVFAAGVGFLCVLGSCGGIEHGGDFQLGEQWVLAGLGLIGLGAWALRTALK